MLLTLDEVVKHTKDLPVFNPIAAQIIQEAGKADTSAHLLAKLILRDQSLAAKVLRLANSSYYGLPRRVENLEQAVVVLGTHSIRNLALAAASYPWLSRPLTGFNLKADQLWMHSFGTGVAAGLVAKLTRSCDNDLALTSGLLHDIGLVALGLWMSTKSSALLQYAQREGLPFHEVEKKVLGFDHTQVGEALAEVWNIPPAMVRVIRWHHEPQSNPNPTALVDCVHIGIQLMAILNKGLSEAGFAFDFDEASLSRLGINMRHLDSVADNVLRSMDEYAGLFMEDAA